MRVTRSLAGPLEVLSTTAKRPHRLSGPWVRGVAFSGQRVTGASRYLARAQLMKTGKGHAPASPCVGGPGHLDIIRNCGEVVNPSHHSLNCVITVSVSCQPVTGTHDTPAASTG
jgi:hypothetical protein